MNIRLSRKNPAKALAATAAVVVAVAALLATTGCLHAPVSQVIPTAAAATVTRPALPALAAVKSATQRASHGRVEAVSVFAGPDGLVGAVVQAANDAHQRNIVWFTPNLAAVVVHGHLVSANGGDLTLQAKYTQGLLLRPSEALAKTSLPDSHAITVGTAGPLVTAFFDPNCIYCHMLYTELAPMALAGKLRLRMVLVGVIKASSLPRAATILASKTPAAAMAYDEDHFDVQTENGGVAVATPQAGSPAAQVLAQRMQTVEANTKLFSATGATGTPAILYCSKTTQQTHLMVGVPRDIHTLLGDLAPAPTCKP